MSELELRLPPDAGYVGLARTVIAAAAERAGMSNERVEDVKLAVSEAAANAIVAQRAARDEADEVVLAFGPIPGEAFQVTVTDAGPGFDPEQVGAQPRDEDGMAESGLGLKLIQGLADDVDFVRAGGMQVQMRFVVSMHDGVGPESLRGG